MPVGGHEMCAFAGCNERQLYGSSYCAIHMSAEEAEEFRRLVERDKKYTLRGENLFKAPLPRMDLSDAILISADLRKAILVMSSLENAQLVEAELQEARLDSCNLDTANLSKAKLEKAKLGNANLQGATLEFAEAQKADFHNSHLQSAKLGRAHLEGADFTGAEANGAKFINADMSRAVLADADLSNVDLSGVTLTEASLWKAKLYGANLTDTDLTRASLRDIQFTEYLRVPESLHWLVLKVWIAMWSEKADDWRPLKCLGMIIAVMMFMPFLMPHLIDCNCLYLVLPIWPTITLMCAFYYHSKLTKIDDANLVDAGLYLRKARSASTQNKWPQRVLMTWVERIVCATKWKGAAVDSVGRCDPLKLRYIKDQSYLEAKIEESKQGPWYLRLWMFIWGITSGYGQNIWLWISWSALLAVSFGVVYWLGSDPCTLTENGHKICNPSNLVFLNNTPSPLFTAIYFSVVTFTTLGFGDVTPYSGIGQAVVMFEVILGYIMLGGLISILATKLARLAG